MRCLRIIVCLVLSLSVGAEEGQGQSVLDQKILGQGAYSQDFIDVFSGLHNQASLAGMKSFSIGMLVQQRFSIKELRAVSLAAGLPVNRGTITLQAFVEGLHRFRRQEWRVGYTHQLFDWMSLGGSLDYFRMQVPESGNASAFTFSLSALFHVYRKWRLGIQVFNPEKARYGQLGEDQLPAIFQVGIGFQVSPIFLLIAEGRFSGKKKSLLLGMQYKIIRELALSVGVSTGVNPVYGGLHLYLKKMEILISAGYHRQLGLSPAAGVIYINQSDDE